MVQAADDGEGRHINDEPLTTQRNTTNMFSASMSVAGQNQLPPATNTLWRRGRLWRRFFRLIRRGGDTK